MIGHESNASAERSWVDEDWYRRKIPFRWRYTEWPNTLCGLSALPLSE